MSSSQSPSVPKTIVKLFRDLKSLKAQNSWKFSKSIGSWGSWISRSSRGGGVWKVFRVFSNGRKQEVEVRKGFNEVFKDWKVWKALEIFWETSGKLQKVEEDLQCPQNTWWDTDHSPSSFGLLFPTLATSPSTWDFWFTFLAPCWKLMEPLSISLARSHVYSCFDIWTISSHFTSLALLSYFYCAEDISYWARASVSFSPSLYICSPAPFIISLPLFLCFLPLSCDFPLLCAECTPAILFLLFPLFPSLSCTPRQYINSVLATQNSKQARVPFTPVSLSQVPPLSSQSQSSFQSFEALFLFGSLAQVVQQPPPLLITLPNLFSNSSVLLKT